VSWCRGMLGALILACAVGCGSDDASEPASDVAESGDPRPVVSIESLGGTATLSGVVRFVGTPPDPHQIRVAGDAYCVDVHGDAFEDPDVVLDAEGHLQNVFVYLASGVPDRHYAVPTETVSIDQSGCMYVPRVLGVQVGQKLAFRNSDQTLHNVHSVVDRELGNRPFNFGMPGRKGVVVERVFQVPEIMARIKCDVHPWMVAWVGVLSHPWFSVTDSTGRFSIDRVPDGTYDVEAWHEVFGRTQTTVQVTAGVAAPLEIRFGEPSD